MRNLIRSVALLAVLGSRVSIAQTTGSARSPVGLANQAVSSWHGQDSRSVYGAPIGHRQPRTSDVLSENSEDIERLSAEDAVVDRKLNICRGC
jgi:hypothetical protein